MHGLAQYLDLQRQPARAPKVEPPPAVAGQRIDTEQILEALRAALPEVVDLQLWCEQDGLALVARGAVSRAYHLHPVAGHCKSQGKDTAGVIADLTAALRTAISDALAR